MIRQLPTDPAALAELARRALAEGEEEAALPTLAAAAEREGSDARLWQWTGLLYRALDRHAEALDALSRAARLAPDDASITHGIAQTSAEAGRDAVDLFERAHRLDPANGALLLGKAAAQFAAGDGARAVEALEAILVRAPGWIEGHEGLARLRAMNGDADRAPASLMQALNAYPGDRDLWRALILLLSRAERYPEMLAAIRQGRAAIGSDGFFDANEAVALSETGDTARADALFARVAGLGDPGIAVHQVRHWMRSGRVEQALPLIEQGIADPSAPGMWPYAAAAWRMTGDPRWQWLEGDPRLVSVIDLSDRLPPLDRLAEVLRGLHQARGAPLDQSVRGGTQTDGMLFHRLEPEIRALRAAVVEAVANHIAQLPAIDPHHPTLRHRRDRPARFAGAWSVRLTDGGSHANHVHPFGWLSSALYIALPQADPGWLTLGAPQAELGLDLPPLRRIEPRPGQLVLFPSTMWHGTEPFERGERLTVAFDVAPPR